VKIINLTGGDIPMETIVVLRKFTKLRVLDLSLLGYRMQEPMKHFHSIYLV
jgi:hypothetical protein